MILKRLVLVLVWSVSWLAVAPAGAQNLKVGYVNVEQIMAKAPQAEAAEKKIKAEFGPRDRDLVAMRDKLKKLEDELEKNALVMKETERRDKEREIVDVRRSLKREAQEFREDVNLRRNEELRELQKLILDAVTDIAKNEKFDLILHAGAVYASDKIDITEKVLKQLKGRGATQ